MNILGETKVFKREINGRELYSTTIGSKDANGNWENMYLDVSLPKESQIENGEKINITKGFLSFYKDKNGIAKVKVVVQEYEKETIEPSNATNYSDDDLPF